MARLLFTIIACCVVLVTAAKRRPVDTLRGKCQIAHTNKTADDTENEVSARKIFILLHNWAEIFDES